MEFKNIYEKLKYIQQNLKAPKGQMNTFGGYSYRSCEDILESVKPLLAETNTVVVLNDDIITIDQRYYVKATAILIDCDKENSAVSNNAFAREEETKKGMDGSQITGASSSYARKYALNGLFAIDDLKDSDATNKHGKDLDTKLVKELKELGGTVEICATYYGVKVEDLTNEQIQDLINKKRAELDKALVKDKEVNV